MTNITWKELTFPPLNLWNMTPTNAMIDIINDYYFKHYSYLWE